MKGLARKELQTEKAGQGGSKLDSFKDRTLQRLLGGAEISLNVCCAAGRMFICNI